MCPDDAIYKFPMILCVLVLPFTLYTNDIVCPDAAIYQLYTNDIVCPDAAIYQLLIGCSKAH